MKKIKHFQTIVIYGLYILLLIIIVSSFFSLRSYTKNVLNSLNTITPYIETEDWERVNKLFEEFKEKNKNKLKRLSFIVKHTTIDDILLDMVSISLNISLKNKELCMEKLEILKHNIEHLYDSQIPKLQNIL